MFLVAATRRGLTPCPPALGNEWPCPGMGVLVPGVATGVVKFDGNSEVKMVAVDGDRTYLELRTDNRLDVKPE